MQQLTKEGLAALQQQPLMLIDVREPQEHTTFNIGGTLMPLGDIMNMHTAIPTNIPVVIYCSKGIRSQLAIQRLEEKYGYTNLINLTGGIGDGSQKQL